MESELKMLFNAEELPKLKSLAILEKLAVEPPTSRQLINIYFDTPELDLHRTGIELRIRRLGEKRLQTLKAGGSMAGGLHRREEWEMEVEGDNPNLEALLNRMNKHSAYGAALSKKGLEHRLQPVITTKVNRTIRRIRLHTGDDVEMAVDQGTIECGQTKEPLCELELELKSGAPRHLYPFALSLLEAIPMRISTLSKAQRGYAMLQRTQKTIVKASKLQLDPDMSVEQAFDAVIANCMAQVLGNEHGVTHGTDPESVHQMRVGLRRLRSALGLFRSEIECPTTLQEEWRWLAAQLGAARDWEVFADSTLEHLAEILPDNVDLGEVKRAALAQASAHRQEAAKAVISVRHTRLQLQFAEWMEARSWRQSLPGLKTPPNELSLKKFTKQTLEHIETRLLKRGKRFKDNEPVSRHRARIAAKKARYATEFFGALYAKTKVKEYVGNLSDLQEELGWLNDAAVAIGLLNRLQLSNPKISSDVAFISGYLFAYVNGHNEKLMHSWKKFKRTPPPYKH